MKMNAMILAAFMLAPLMTKAQTTIIEPLTNEERGEVAVWVDSLGHDRDDRDDRDDDRRRRPKQTECPGLTLDDTQKASLKTAMFAFQKGMNLAKAETKNAMMDYGMTLSDAASTKDQGVAAGTAVKDAFNKMGDLKMNFEIGVFYDILKPEQREPAMKCAMQHMKDMMKKKLEKMCKNLKP
ncbi:hypothetical protein D3C87_1308840 [compost metagenome]